jgi:hypothetical protein
MLLEFCFIVLLEDLFYTIGARRSFMRLSSLLSIAGICGAVVCGSIFTEDSSFEFDLDFLQPPVSSVKPKTCNPNVCTANNEFANLTLLDPDLIISFLTSSPLRLQNILPFDVYNFTYPLQRRSLHTIPSLALLLQDIPTCNWSTTVKPFLRFVPRARFTPKSTNILTYLSMLTDHDFIEDIDIDEFTTLDIPEVLPLFKNIRLEEREFGAMCSLQLRRNNWIVSFTLPVLYLENNYFLTEKEQDAIQAAPLFSGGTVPKPALTPSIDFSTFTEDHLINDKGGIGDLRAECWYELSHERCSAYIGGQITIPTAHVVLSGIAGAPDSAFCQKILPYFDIQTMFNLYTAGTSNAAVTLATMVANLGIDALDRLSSILLNNPLGTKHIGLGPIFRADGCLGHPNITFQVTSDIAYYIPRQEVRYFKTVKNAQEFNRDYSNSAQAQNNLNFLMQQATDTLYPTAVCIKVHPGWTINLTSALRFFRPKYVVTIGYNFWAKTHEHLGCLEKTFGVCDSFSALYGEARYNNDKILDLAAGKLSSALQGKLFASITSTIRSKNSYDIRTGIRADATLHTYALGKDFTIAIDFIIDF